MESGTIPDDQITASSSWDEYHSPYLGRLHLDSIYAWPNHTGGWTAGTNDVNQWLQIDLGIEYNITRVATQGRQDLPHWVTKYNLQYSDDGVTFYTCVDDQGQAEVTIIGCTCALSPQKRYVMRCWSMRTRAKICTSIILTITCYSYFSITFTFLLPKSLFLKLFSNKDKSI